MKHPAPRPGKESAAPWQGAREGRLLLPYCASCAAFRWPPRQACASCGAALDWRESGGTGRIATWSFVRRAADPNLRDDAPYVVAFVELDEGVRLFTNIVDAAPEEVRGGQRVRCRFEPTMDPDMHVPVFTIIPEDR